MGGHRAAWDERLAEDQNSFDLIRLVLAGLVLVYHAGCVSAVDGCSLDPLFRISGGQIDLGAFGVHMFFALSGFLVTRSWLLTNSVSGYLTKRVARIVPGFVVSALAGLFLFGPVWWVHPAEYFAGVRFDLVAARILTLHPLGLHSFAYNPKHLIDAASWTIRAEFDCYIILAALGATRLLRPTVVIPLALGAILLNVFVRAGAVQMPLADHGLLALATSTPRAWPRLLSYFLAGSAFYLIRDHVPKSRILFGLCAGAVLLSLLFGGAAMVAPACATYCLLWIGLSTRGRLQIGGRRTDLSYGVYLYHYPLEQTIVAAVGPVSGGFLALGALPMSCMLAYLSWRFVEAPALRWAHGFRSARRPVDLKAS